MSEDPSPGSYLPAESIPVESDADELETDTPERPSDLSDADEKFLNGNRSHPQRETIAYCPECKTELDDFGLQTQSPGIGRCRSCHSVAWMSFEAQILIASDCVTISTLRERRSTQAESNGGDGDE